MNIIRPHKSSKSVESFDQIKELARDLQAFLESGKMWPDRAHQKNSIALHHSQVDPEPFNFFVIRRAIVRAKPNEVVVVVNPKILERSPEKEFVLEGCISFPFRPDKRVKRNARVKVSYQVPNEKGELVSKEEWIEGLMAYVFQHECQHSHGGNIYQ